MAKEKKFGLIIPKQKQAVASRLKPAAFDDDDELGSEKKKIVETAAPKIKKHVEAQLEKALAEDPTVFQYDEVYNEMVSEKVRVAETKKEKEKREPKYVKALLTAAEKRQQEYDAREERKQLKEREKEAGEFDDKEVFVTGAYRKKMEELQAYKEEQKRKERLEGLMDVTKQKDLTGFYKHFLNDQLAAQGDVPKKDEDSTKEQRQTDDAEKRESTKKKTQKPFRARERHASESSSSNSDEEDRRQITKKRRRTESFNSDEERQAIEELKASKNKRGRSGGRVQTENEKKRRFFTPSPSPEHKNRTTYSKSTKRTEDRKTSKDVSRRREKSAEKQEKKIKKEKSPTPVKQEPKLSEEEEKELKMKERLAKMKKLFARRNDEQSIEEYRRRYLERKAA